MAPIKIYTEQEIKNTGRHNLIFNVGRELRYDPNNNVTSKRVRFVGNIYTFRAAVPFQANTHNRMPFNDGDRRFYRFGPLDPENNIWCEQGYETHIKKAISVINRENNIMQIMVMSIKMQKGLGITDILGLGEKTACDAIIEFMVNKHSIGGMDYRMYMPDDEPNILPDYVEPYDVAKVLRIEQ